jgi:archaeosine-15-forming tRNA-guanine transglycosylase
MHVSENATFTITMGVAACVVVFSVMATWRITGKLSSIDNNILSMRQELDNSFTLDKASEQALRMAIENPGMRVPDPRDPTKIIEVKSRDDESKSSVTASTRSK